MTSDCRVENFFAKNTLSGNLTNPRNDTDTDNRKSLVGLRERLRLRIQNVQFLLIYDERIADRLLKYNHISNRIYSSSLGQTFHSLNDPRRGGESPCPSSREGLSSPAYYPYRTRRKEGESRPNSGVPDNPNLIFRGAWPPNQRRRNTPDGRLTHGAGSRMEGGLGREKEADHTSRVCTACNSLFRKSNLFPTILLFAVFHTILLFQFLIVSSSFAPFLFNFPFFDYLSPGESGCRARRLKPVIVKCMLTSLLTNYLRTFAGR